MLKNTIEGTQIFEVFSQFDIKFLECMGNNFLMTCGFFSIMATAGTFGGNLWKTAEHIEEAMGESRESKKRTRAGSSNIPGET